jgi:CheY-like chemotaxis protein
MSRILIADDEPGMRETLSEILSDAGYDVTAVSDGDAAFDSLTHETFDVALLDVRMPGRDGVAVLVDSGAPPPPVILMTAYTVEDRLSVARASRVHAVVQKPFATSYLLELVAGAAAVPA